MDVSQALLEAGGIAPTSVLLRAVPRHEVRVAVKAGLIVPAGRGSYSLPDVDEHRVRAAALSGALCLLSAARYWGWPVKLPPERPQIVVPRGRKVPMSRRAAVDLSWGEVSPQELEAGVTSMVRTVLECARQLPLDVALAVVDSALRDGLTKTELLLACARLPRTGRAKAYAVVEMGDARAANPFESVLRAVLKAVKDAHFEPQIWIGGIGRPDLAGSTGSWSRRTPSSSTPTRPRSPTTWSATTRSSARATWCCASGGSTPCSSRTTSGRPLRP